MVVIFVSKAGHILQQFLLMSKELLLQIGIPPFVCQKSSPSFEKSTPKEKSSSTKTIPKNKAVFNGRKRGIIGPSSI
ncbi:unnamed protein product [Acanthoscelides obtectus]|uniref:Uncharacterized protein n=1 Tax=Acanthoscelides obtectus TaxID=200917 RepID=A0A9P0PED4_ACAOB|nr:unnamed protein product [Acanthoscelides obtectus]CAK1638257.1 hypothetical protein AOBTE_LOCUS10491 [Acanthoscelides obtectus]